MTSTKFKFDGVESTTMHVDVIRMEGGLVPTPFLGSKSIVEDKIYGKDIPFFYGIEKQPLTFSVTFSMSDGYSFNSQTKFDLAKWLFKDTYKVFQTYDDLTKLYYAICTNAEELFTTIGDNGYFTATFRCNAPWAYTQVYEATHDLSLNETTTTIVLNNQCNINQYYFPSIEFTLVGAATGISIVNSTDANRTFAFTNLTLLETVSVDNTNKYILSDVPGVYRFGNFNKNWLRLVYGNNSLVVTGKCSLKTKMCFPIIK